MQESRDNHFDPEVLDAFLSVRDRVVQVQLAFADEN
jgi:response regulator RpfG family c-di-GMP phosphodiesterase